ncbi:DEAD/DEAH box helicase [Clostridium sp. YIM B02505]|uniref:DEAD/DEAH box helicase n=1 Tax=Clostridium yunnanense TaxID=2800325 RepID=A0ABS1EL59_9CLOT|nr:DEAD/DEAH box helicase [Clostridium yunnanense]MBK1810113.1 DEAD/DEAH box helicase [Clostridium yunnanense]
MNFRYGNLGELCKPHILKKGETYYTGEYVFDFEIQDIEEDLSRSIRCYVASEYFDQYLVNFQIDFKNKLMEGKCTCANYLKDGKVCSHIAAGYLHYLNKLAKKEVKKVSIVEQMVKLYDNLVTAKKHKEPVKLDVILTLNKEITLLDLKVGTDKLYSVRDLERFLLDIKKEDCILEFGKGFILDLNEQYFEVPDNNLIYFLQDLLSIGEIASEKGTPNKLFQGKYIKLVDSSLKRVLEHCKEKSITIVIDSDKYENCRICTDELKFETKIEEELVVMRVKPKINLPVPVTIDYEYMFYDKKIYRCDKRNANKLKAICTFFMGSENNELIIPNREKGLFIGKILPVLNTISNIELPETLKKKLEDSGAPLTCKFYFDKVGKHVGLKVKFNYKIVEIDAVSEKYVPKDVSVIRDIDKEEEVKNLLISMGFIKNKDNLIISDEEKIIELQSEGLEKLAEFGDVYYSEDFKKFKVIKKLTLSASTSINEEDLLEFSFNIDELTNEELVGTIKALRSGKKYYKASDKGFIMLDDPMLQNLNKVLESLNIKESSLLNDKVDLDKYNALYLNDKINKYLSGNIVKKDDSFSKLIDSFEGVNKEKISIPKQLNCQMRNYQIDGYKWLKTLKKYGFGGILADEMGLGKTLQTISLLLSEKEDQKTNPSIVICPTSLLYNWKEELERFAPSLRVLIYYGSKANRSRLEEEFKNVDVILTTYPIVRIDIEELKEHTFNIAIIDEAQNIKNSISQNSRSVKELRAENRFALTGTPIENSLMELWSIFDFIMPGFLFSSNSFKKKYELPIIKDDDKTALNELLSKVTPFILRRKKKDVLSELPPKIERKVSVELNKEQRKLYSTYVKIYKNEIQANIEKNGVNKSKLQILSALTRLRQLCCDPSTFINDYTGGSSKLDTLYELIESCIQEGHRILLFSQFTSALKNIEKHLQETGISYMYLDGSVKSEERLKLVNSFNSGNSSVFLISLKAGGAGLNLTSADVVIHFDPWWNPAVEDQATDRAHRIGQENSVEVIKLIAKGTIEEKIYKLQEKKKDIINNVMEEESIASSVISTMNIDDIKELFNETEF